LGISSFSLEIVLLSSPQGANIKPKPHYCERKWFVPLLCVEIILKETMVNSDEETQIETNIQANKNFLRNPDRLPRSKQGKSNRPMELKENDRTREHQRITKA
jgi:hypothetical protein